MLIQTRDLQLYEAIFEFCRANGFIADAADMSRQMGRSRSYLSTLRYSGHPPSHDAYERLKDFLKSCRTGVGDDSLRRWFNHYINQIDEVLS